jgi:hypothetical protein
MKRPYKKYNWIHECDGKPERKRRIDPGDMNKWRMRKWCVQTEIYYDGRKFALLQRSDAQQYEVSITNDPPFVFRTLREAIRWLGRGGYELFVSPYEKYDASRYVPHQQSFVPRPEIRKVALKTPEHPPEPNSGIIEI